MAAMTHNQPEVLLGSDETFAERVDRLSVGPHESAPSDFVPIAKMGFRMFAIFTGTLVMALLVCVLLPVTVLGWKATALESGSMAPLLERGDIVIVGEVPEETLSKGTVVMFVSDEGESTVHRIQSVDARSREYFTKGDANHQRDTAVLSQDQITGVGKLLIPTIGTPFLWVHEGSYGQLVALLFGGSFVLWAGRASGKNQR